MPLAWHICMVLRRKSNIWNENFQSEGSKSLNRFTTSTHGCSIWSYTQNIFDDFKELWKEVAGTHQMSPSQSEQLLRWTRTGKAMTCIFWLTRVVFNNIPHYGKYSQHWGLNQTLVYLTQRIWIGMHSDCTMTILSRSVICVNYWWK